MDPRIQAVLSMAPSAFDKPGAIYVYEIPAKQPNSPNQRSRRTELKYGRAKEPTKRRAQWLRKCRGQDQRWLCYWNIPFAAKFEKLIHTHFKLKGAWLGRTACDFCKTEHQEKYDKGTCGGRAVVVQEVEFYLGLLGWPILRVDM
ncbi:hypothetical protein B0H15DRAFT_865939 [Mycena belliarum]|uniref:Bacteriophage T5 Orf172 DNA-binding domain-containing protein n=1 Tax=Mycena belliarum TaxID=1033014 RepID=A0AAD6TUU6_9AGAR|nr:hypothetical protein B0H15DRAFT_865939 [Mycena belliae]